MQYRTSTGYALSSKRSVLTNLFWFLRANIENGRTDFSGSETHPHNAARLLDVIGKMSMMHDTGVPDRACSQPATKLHLEKLSKTRARLEGARIKARPGWPASEFRPNKLSNFAGANADIRYTKARHHRWDEISVLIDQFSRMPRALIDNEQSIAFIGDNYSVPHS